MEMGVYIPRGTVMTLLLRDSPFEVHRKVFKEGLEKRGGFVPEAIPPPEENQRVQDGLAVGVATDDTLTAYKHMYLYGKESFYSAYIGFYYFLKLPIKDEIDQALLALQESGVINKVIIDFSSHDTHSLCFL